MEKKGLRMEDEGERVNEEHGRQGWKGSYGSFRQHLTMPCQWVGASVAKAFKVLE